MSAGRFGADRRGDSSTIGVVLMIGIAVILAAVVFGSFAGLGDEKLSDPPKATIDVTFDQGSVGGFSASTDDDGQREAVVVVHESGDEVNWLYVQVLVNGTRVTSTPGLDYVSPPTELTAGDQVRIEGSASTAKLTPGTTIRVVYVNPNTDDTLVFVDAEIP
jgi:flagellin-like protein